MEMTVIVPATVYDMVTRRLRRLTLLLQEAGVEAACGILGGSDGYGAEFKNDVFEMHPYHWGDCTCGAEVVREQWGDAHPHRADCYQWAVRDIRWDAPDHDARYKQACELYGIPWDNGYGCAAHCTCGRVDEWDVFVAKNRCEPHCHVVRPNFKCGAFEVRWYKWIGRDNEVITGGLSEAEIEALFDRCDACVRNLGVQ